MTSEDISKILGNVDVARWPSVPLNPIDINNALSVVVVGGSTQKPSTNAKKQQAIEIGQVLGQFAGANPIVLVFALRALEQAFDEIVIKDEDWKQIQQSIEQSIQANQNAQQKPSTNNIADQLTPEQQKQVVSLMQQGVSVNDAVSQVMENNNVA